MFSVSIKDVDDIIDVLYYRLESDPESFRIDNGNYFSNEFTVRFNSYSKRGDSIRIKIKTSTFFPPSVISIGTDRTEDCVVDLGKFLPFKNFKLRMKITRFLEQLARIDEREREKTRSKDHDNSRKLLLNYLPELKDVLFEKHVLKAGDNDGKEGSPFKGNPETEER